jgi:hypothetical protein
VGRCSDELLKVPFEFDTVGTEYLRCTVEGVQILADLASSLSRIGAAIGTYLMPISLTDIGIGPTMIIGAVVTLVGAGISVQCAPETRNRALADCASLTTSPHPDATLKPRTGRS